MADTLIWVGLDNTRKMSAKCLLILSVKMIFIFYGTELTKLAKMVGAMHQADHAYSIWSTW